MRYVSAFTLGVILGIGTGCGSSVSEQQPGNGAGGGTATVAIADTTYAVSKVSFHFETGEEAYFRIEGEDAAHPNDDCLPALGGGLALYGDLPDGVTSLADLSGKEAPFEFTGDGDDFNLCFVGTNGLLGVENGKVRFGKIEGTSVAFSFSGSFVRYDGKGGQSSLPISASGSGTAHVSR